MKIQVSKTLIIATIGGGIYGTLFTVWTFQLGWSQAILLLLFALIGSAAASIFVLWLNGEKALLVTSQSQPTVVEAHPVKLDPEVAGYVRARRWQHPLTAAQLAELDKRFKR